MVSYSLRGRSRGEEGKSVLGENEDYLYTIFGDKRKLLNHILSIRTYFSFTFIVRTARSKYTRFTYQCFPSLKNLLDFCI
jgi:hypothetical protein